ncbi:hypothetical protein [Actinomadura roseirufa]|uniref:hypothetical protein n=1 Tax=Actinomadura roseirufa TaxID=2094049 RepID=UPI0013F17DE9|nr:hypothetical protein [Actinomadura roseirufa]
MGIGDVMRAAALAARLDVAVKAAAGEATPRAVFGGRAVEAARRLAEMVDRAGGADPLALRSLTRFHLARHQALPVAEGSGDLAAAARFAMMLIRADPSALPAPFALCRDAGEVSALLTAERAMPLLRENGSQSDPAMLDDAVRLLETSSSALAEGHPLRGMVLSRLSAALLARFLGSRLAADVDRAVVIGRAAVAGSDSDIEKARAAFNLGQALLARYTERTVVVDLEEALTTLESSVALTSPGDPELERRTARLQAARETRQRFEELLDDGVAISRAALDFWAEDESRRVENLENLGLFAFTRFERSGSSEDLDEAVTALRDAVAATDPSDEGLARRGLYLGDALLARSRLSGTAGELDEAVRVTRDALEHAAEGSADRAACAAALGGQLRIRAQRDSSIADLDEAIGLCREAVRHGPVKHRLLGRINLVGALGTRFEWLGALADLHEAIDIAEAAVAEADAGQRAVCLSNLSVLRRRLYEQSDDPDDLDEAIETARAAVAAGFDSDPGRDRHLANVSALLAMRGLLDSARPGDLDEAISAAESALALTPDGHWDRPRWTSNLALVLRNRAERARSVSGASEAVAVGRAALDALPPAHTDRSAVLSNLASCLQLRAQLTGDDADLHAALDLLTEGGALTTAPVGTRLQSLRGAAEMAMGPAPEAAVRFYETAVGLLPLAASRAIERRSQERRLQSVAGLAGDAAAGALAIGDVTKAVELLDHGRNVIWNQILDTHDDLAELRARHPGLARELASVARELADPADGEPE